MMYWSEYINTPSQIPLPALPIREAADLFYHITRNAPVRGGIRRETKEDILLLARIRGARRSEQTKLALFMEGW